MKGPQPLTNVKKKSVSQIIYEFLLQDQGKFHAGYEFVNRSIGVGNMTYFLGSSSDRKARLMAERGVIERKYEGGYAFYRVKPKIDEYELYEPKLSPELNRQ